MPLLAFSLPALFLSPSCSAADGRLPMVAAADVCVADSAARAKSGAAHSQKEKGREGGREAVAKRREKNHCLRVPDI